MVNWKTTLLGVASLLIALGGLGSSLKLLASGDIAAAFDAMKENYAAILAAIAGLGLIFARDSDKTSEESGAK